MKKGIIGRKLGMTQIFTKDGAAVAVSVVQTGPCVVLQKKTKEKEGYDAIQVGFVDIKPKYVNKPMAGHFKKADAAPKRYLKEFRLDSCEEHKPGGIITTEIFKEGELVDVSGIGKGKGFAGTIKRYGAHLLKASHGTGPVRRQPGSMSGASDPSRIFKGKKMPGRMGGKKVSVLGLELMHVDVEKNLIAIKGSIPGPRGGVVIIRNSVKAIKSEE